MSALKWLGLVVEAGKLLAKLLPGKKRPKPGPDVKPITDDDLRKRR